MKWLEVFKAGKHTSSNGITREYSPADLDQVVESYDPDHFRAPLIVSYPAHNTAGYSDTALSASQLAYGFPSKLKREGDRLMAGFEKISNQVKEWVNGGQILGFSSSFYLPESERNPYPGKLALRHIAACGVNPPAVKGMEVPELAEPLADFADYAIEDENAVDFAFEGVDEATLNDARLGVQIYQAIRNIDAGVQSFMADDYGVSQLARVMQTVYQKMRDAAIAKDGVEKGNESFPAFMLDELTALTNRPIQTYATAEDLARLWDRLDEMDYGYGDKKKKMMMNYQEGEQMPDAIENKTVSVTEFEEMKAQNELLTKQLQVIQKERETERVTSFVEGLIRDRKLPATDRDTEIRDILLLPNDQVASYGEDGELTPRQRYMNKLSARKPVVSGGTLPIGPEHEPQSFSDRGVDYSEGYAADTIKIDRAVRERVFAKKGNPSNPADYEEAWDELITEGKLSASF